MVTPRDVVLVADDDEDIVRFVEVNLRLEGFEVATASDGERALQEAFDILPDLLLLDVMMPKIDGFEVCQRLRGDPRTKQMCIIMLTAKGLELDLEGVREQLGINAVFAKPFSPSSVVEAACHFLEAPLVAQSSPS